LGIGYGGLAPTPNPQSPIPNPHEDEIIIIFLKIIFYYLIYIKKIL
jgi:hypothetical protein